MPFWQRILIAGAVLLIAMLAARMIDRRISRRPLPPEAVTRYRVLRRTITALIVAVGLLSALLVIPQVRAVAGGILASSAIVGLVVGFAARSPIANFVSGLLIAITQPLRLGDTVDVRGVSGVVEEIGLTYTFIRARDNSRLVIPNELLASDTIRNSTIVSRETLAEATVQVPQDTDLGAAVRLLGEALAGRPDAQVLVSGLNERATLTVRTRVSDETGVEAVASELRLLAHARLREAGLLQ
jgi:small-conductance mechanosensitive channel